MVMHLQGRRLVRAEDLSAHFEMSVRTLYRDSAALGEDARMAAALDKLRAVLPRERQDQVERLARQTEVVGRPGGRAGGREFCIAGHQCQEKPRSGV